MMEKRLTAAFWGVLLGVAAYQSPGWWDSATDPRVDGDPVPPVVEAKVEPQETVKPRIRAEARTPKMPYKIDLKDAKQIAEFFPGSEPVEEGATLSRNAPGNSGPYDGDGKLIMPLDFRSLD